MPLDNLSKISGQCLPLFPPSCTRHLQASQQLSVDTIDTYLDSSASESAGNSCRKSTGRLLTEVNTLQLDIVTVMDISYIHTHLIVLLGLDTFRESHCLGFHLAVGIEFLYRLHALISRHDGRETTVGIVFELLNSHATTETPTLRQLTGMIEEITVSFIVGHTTMIRERTSLTERHDLACIGPRTCRRRCCTVGDMLRYATSGIEQLIGSVALCQPRTFHI